MDDISVYVLKPFPFSRDGIKEEHAEASTTIDIPGRLFAGLNKEGYVRRAVIGDGHVTLRSKVAEQMDTLEANFVEAIETSTGPGGAITAAVSNLGEAMGRTIEISNGSVRAAPQPPVKTAGLSEGEMAAIADGTWKNLKFFAKRSIAAKLSDTPIKNAADADAAIEAYIASKG